MIAFEIEFSAIAFEMELPVDESDEVRFLDTVRGLIEPIRVERGCLDCRLCRSIRRNRGFFFIQKWQDEEAFSRHIRSRTFRLLLIALDLLSGPPKICVRRNGDTQILATFGELYDAFRESDNSRQTAD